MIGDVGVWERSHQTHTHTLPTPHPHTSLPTPLAYTYPPTPNNFSAITEPPTTTLDYPQISTHIHKFPHHDFFLYLDCPQQLRKKWLDGSPSFCGARLFRFHLLRAMRFFKFQRIRGTDKGVRFCGVKIKKINNKNDNAPLRKSFSNGLRRRKAQSAASIVFKETIGRPTQTRQLILAYGFIWIAASARSLKPTRQMVQIVLGFSCGPIGSKWVLMDSVDSQMCRALLSSNLQDILPITIPTQSHASKPPAQPVSSQPG